MLWARGRTDQEGGRAGGGRRGARRLRALGDRKRAAFARRFDGAAAEVLVESTRDPETGALRGYTRNYLRAGLDGPDALMGRRVPVRLAVGPDSAVRATVTGA